jgi:hypothetical protein
VGHLLPGDRRLGWSVGGLARRGPNLDAKFS